jgi:hypothetical protein
MLFDLKFTFLWRNNVKLRNNEKFGGTLAVYVPLSTVINIY